MAIHNPDLDRPPKVLTQTLAVWLGRAATTVRNWVARGILPQPQRLGQKTVLHDVAAVLRALSHRIPWGLDGYVERKARMAARRAGLNGGPVALAEAPPDPPPPPEPDDDQGDDDDDGFDDE